MTDEPTGPDRKAEAEIEDIDLYDELMAEMALPGLFTNEGVVG